jgi:hypothetical protein
MREESIALNQDLLDLQNDQDSPSSSPYKKYCTG